MHFYSYMIIISTPLYNIQMKRNYMERSTNLGPIQNGNEFWEELLFPLASNLQNPSCPYAMVSNNYKSLSFPISLAFLSPILWKPSLMLFLIFLFVGYVYMCSSPPQVVTVCQRLYTPIFYIICPHFLIFYPQEWHDLLL